MKYSTRQYAQALYEALHATADADHEKILDKFVALLQENGDLGKFTEIEQAFVEHEKTAKGIKIAEVTTARKMPASEEEKLVRELNDYLGEKVELKKKVDEGILGGVIIQIEDKLIDGSVRRNLQDLKNNIAT